MKHCTPTLVVAWLLACVACASTGHTDDLFSAAARGDVSAIRECIQNGADPNARSRDGKTALHLAVEQGDVKLSQALIEGGSDPRIRSTVGYSSYFVASVIQQNLVLTAILMRSPDNSASAMAYPLVDFGSGPSEPRVPADTASLIHWNPRFGYRFVASPDWTLVRVTQDGIYDMQSYVVFSLPPIWSETEKQDISDAVAIFAKEDPKVDSLDRAVEAFWDAMTRAGEPENKRVAGSEHHRIIVDFDHIERGLRYRRRGIIRFQEGVYYHFNFIATPGTFDMNLPVFATFCDSITLSKPEKR